ncbi:nucleoside diphosphate kinase (plasmid) [Streptomyces alboflavus]|uniref:nucleoside-diphosphate kinase n=1 Tax=Streptomyces alboflavus TaxID=67267 RepID=A0A291W597_9ACTN|nr:nucleoside-diphosphate kinase [Streptomyces alboflavus]ATM24826.1 nucleoside diphosphate kinase [Streptomyces alboflavus]
MSRKPCGGAVVDSVDFARWAVVLCKPDAVERSLVDDILRRISDAGFTITDRRDLTARPWQAHVAYRDLLAGTGAAPQVRAHHLDAAFADRPVVVALAHGRLEIHARLRQLLGHTDPTRAAPGTIRRDLSDDSLAAARAEDRLVRNLVHSSDDPDAARRDFGTWLGARNAPAPDFERCSVILCKPDAVERGLVDAVLKRITVADFTVTDRRTITAQAWQAHVHYWDLLVDADHFPDRDIPACLDTVFADRPVAVALAHGEPGIHDRLRQLLGHFDPLHAAPGTIRRDLGEDSLEAAVAEQRLVRNLVHTSDDPASARRDFGTWFGARHSELLAPPAPLQVIPADT